MDEFNTLPSYQLIDEMQVGFPELYHYLANTDQVLCQLYPILEAAQITSIERLNELDPEDLFVLIPEPKLMFPVIKLRNLLRNMKNTSNDSQMQVDFVPEKCDSRGSDTQELDETEATSMVEQDQPSAKNRKPVTDDMKTFYKTLQVDYTKLINDEHPEIIKYYDRNNKRLRDYHRDHIAATIVRLYIKSSTFMNHSSWDAAATAICEMFPTEDKCLYYVQGSTGHAPRGILYDRYNRLTSQMRKDGTWPSKYRTQRTKCTDNINADDSACTDESLIWTKNWLRTHKSPWPTVEQYWSETYQLRQADMVSEKNLLLEWPLFQHSDGWRLIELDFLKKFGHNGQFLERFPNFVTDTEFFQSHLKDAECLNFLKEFSKYNEDTKDYLALRFLHHLLPPTVTALKKEKKNTKENEGKNGCKNEGENEGKNEGKNGTKKKKTSKPTIEGDNEGENEGKNGTKKKKTSKPTILDSLHSMVIFLQNEENIRLELEDIDAEHKTNRTKRQPLILLIGSVENIEGIFVAVDHVLFKFSNLLSCLDILFKVHYSLNISFACECKLVFEFFERYFYDLKSMNKSTSVTRLISNLKK
ncbi:hypothetical protein DMENIID0001_050870 [Sergentomyia squamirostris]